MTPKGKLSPHAFVEFDLMLEGKKELSFFFGDIEGDNSVDRRFLSLTPEYGIEKLDKKSDFPIHIFYKTGKENKAIFLFNVIEASLINKEKILLKEIDTIIGTLLGYSKEDIDFYLRKNNII